LSLSTADLESIVKKDFTLMDTFLLPDGEAEYKTQYDEKSKKSFERLHATLRPVGYLPQLTGSREEPILRVRRAPNEKVSSRTPVVLSLLTLAAIISYGWLQYLVYGQLIPRGFPLLMGIGYVVSLIAILGLHEFAHRGASKRGNARSPVPYFLPGIPVFTALPSFGTVLVHREPPVNRDALFVTGFLGPLIALVASLALYAFGIVTAASVSIAQIQSGLAALPNIQLTTPNPSFLEVFVASLLGLFGLGTPNVSGYQLISPIAAAADTGLILTFFNLLPATQLDGGQLCESVLGFRGLRVTTYLSILSLLVLDTPNYWVMAVIVLVIAGRPSRIQTLDEISEISRSKKIVFVLALVLGIACIPIPGNIATIPLALG